MLDWFSAHSELANVVLNFIMVLVWVIYLQVFLLTYMKAQRSAMLISIGGVRTQRAQITIGNLGDAPIYVLDVALVMRGKEIHGAALVTDPEFDDPDGADDVGDFTNQGPLRTGDTLNCGAIETLLKRAQLNSGSTVSLSDLEEFEVVALASTANSSVPAAARRRFAVAEQGGQRQIYPLDSTTEQISGRRARLKLQQQLQLRPVFGEGLSEEPPHKLSDGIGTRIISGARETAHRLHQ